MLPARQRKLDNQPDNEAWRAFETDTPAGRLLQKLYGSNTKPQIKYPKLKTKDESGPSGPFIPGGGRIEATDARSNQFPTQNSKRGISVPQPNASKQYPTMHAIDIYRIRRKRREKIQQEVDQIKSTRDIYRPAAVSRTNEENKAKLQQVHTFSPGTVLPKELLPGADLLDRDLAHSGRKGRKSRLEELEHMFDRVSEEIKDRQSYIARMGELGKGEQALNQVQHEIDSRVMELEQINDMIKREENKT